MIVARNVHNLVKNSQRIVHCNYSRLDDFWTLWGPSRCCPNLKLHTVTYVHVHVYQRQLLVTLNSSYETHFFQSTLLDSNLEIPITWGTDNNLTVFSNLPCTGVCWEQSIAREIKAVMRATQIHKHELATKVPGKLLPMSLWIHLYCGSLRSRSPTRYPQRMD